VSGNMKSLLAYVWLAGDCDAVDAFVSADVVPPLLQPGNTSRASALRVARAASRERVIDIARVRTGAEDRL
jgi:hypothetical protein